MLGEIEPGLNTGACRVLLPRHEEPRFHAYVDKETQQAAVQVIFQQESLLLKSAKDLRYLITEELFLVALNNRLFRISRRPDPPFYAAAVSELQKSTSTRPMLLSLS